MKNYAFLVVVSNKPDPINIDVTSGDRRFIVMKGTDAYLENRLLLLERSALELWSALLSAAAAGTRTF